MKPKFNSRAARRACCICERTLGWASRFGVADDAGDDGKAPAQSALDAVDQIVHRAVIEVAEETTEAAAATAIAVVVGAAPARPVTPEPFRVDHPFLFYLVDDTTGAILFEGRIADPR